MNMIEAVKAVFSKYATFEGRARRSEYWWFALFSFIIALILNFIGPVLGGIWSLVALLPSLAVGARRLHDIDRSGWWLLIGFIPLIGLIVLIVFFVKPGQTGANRFGANPLTA